MKLSLSLSQARRLVLHNQGLLTAQAFGKGKMAALAAIERLGYVQIDTISVVERAHHHVFQTRVQDYQQAHLDALLGEDRRVFEYWSHAAAYLPMRDFRYSLPRMQAIAAGDRHWHERPNDKLLNRVLDRIRAEGPLRSKDFAPPPDHNAGPWWNWKPTKIALEHLFQEGRLMVARREKFQKVYDLPERVLPPDVDTSAPTLADTARHLVLRTLDARGFADKKEIGYLRKQVKPQLDAAIRELVESGEILPIAIEGIEKYEAYARSGALENLPARIGKRQMHLLSPFDNLVIQREPLHRLFGFDYQIECYVPQPKRQYGYFCLPILWGDRFIGRLDPKADRKAKVFRVLNLVFEPDFGEFDAALPALAEKVRQFAAYNGCERVEIGQVVPAGLKEALVRHFSG